MEGAHCYRDSGPAATTTGSRCPSQSTGTTQRVLGDRRRGLPRERLPGTAGRYLFSDYCSGTFWAIDAATATSSDTIDPPVVATTNYSISAIAEDSAGELLATDLSTGALLRIGLAGS